jgi:hypothetical protein
MEDFIGYIYLIDFLSAQLAHIFAQTAFKGIFLVKKTTKEFHFGCTKVRFSVSCSSTSSAKHLLNPIRLSWFSSLCLCGYVTRICFAWAHRSRVQSHRIFPALYSAAVTRCIQPAVLAEYHLLLSCNEIAAKRASECYIATDLTIVSLPSLNIFKISAEENMLRITLSVKIYEILMKFPRWCLDFCI